MSRRGKRNFTPEQERTFLHLVSLGAYPSQAALKVGVTSQAISMRKKRNPEFALQIQMAEACAEFAMLAEVRMAKDPRLTLELMARRWPERWARAEVRANLNVSNVDTEALVKGIQEFLGRVGARHAPPDAPDVDVELAPSPPEPPAPSAGVTRS